MSSEITEVWEPIREPLEAIWASLSADPPRAITAGFLSAAYSRIVSLSGRNFLSFFRVVYGDWDACQIDANSTAANGAKAGGGREYKVYSGECARWAAEKFRASAETCLRDAGGRNNEGAGASETTSSSTTVTIMAAAPLRETMDLPQLSRLSKRVHLLQMICNALFSVPDKQRLDRGKMLYGGSAPSVAEIIELVYYGSVVHDCQYQLFNYACSELNRVRGGELTGSLDSIWGTLRYFKAAVPTDNVVLVSPALHRLRENRARIYRELAVTCYTEHMTRFYSSRASAFLGDKASIASSSSVGGLHREFLPWAIAALRKEIGFLARASFPSDISALIHLALLRCLVLDNFDWVLTSPVLCLGRALVERDTGHLEALWTFVKHYLGFNIQRNICVFESRRRVEVFVAEQSEALRKFAEALASGAVTAAEAISSQGAAEPKDIVSASDVRVSRVGSLASLWIFFRTIAAEHFSGFGILLEQMRGAVRKALGEGSTVLDAPPHDVAKAIGAIVSSSSASGSVLVLSTSSSHSLTTSNAASSRTIAPVAATSTSSDDWVLLRDVMELAPLINAIDAFGLEMKQGMGARLLRRSDRSSVDREREMCSMLRRLAGCQAISATLVTMIDDIDKSSSMTNSYSCGSPSAAGLKSKAGEKDEAIRLKQREYFAKSTNITIMVLKKVNWSSFVTYQPFRNAFLRALQRSVSEWYETVHLSAKAEVPLEVTIGVNFSGSKRIAEFTGSTPHVVDVLLAIASFPASSLSDSSPRSIEELAKDLALPARTVGMTASFLRARGAIRCVGDKSGRQQPPPPLRDSSKLEIDTDAVPRTRKISIDPPRTRDEANAAAMRLSEELTYLRAQHLQIALVRVMKRRKDEIVPHDVLVSEALGLVSSFSPTNAAVKLQIEELIRKEIIERAEEQRGAYRYRL